MLRVSLWAPSLENVELPGLKKEGHIALGPWCEERGLALGKL